jgi:hypothetical protein
MNWQIGIILLVADIYLSIWGFNLYGAFSFRVALVFTGSPTDKTAMVLISDGNCMALGIFQLTRRGQVDCAKILTGGT